MADCKSEFIVQRGNVGRIPEWYDLVNNTYRSREMAIQKMKEMKMKMETPSCRYRVIHRITTEVSYEDDIGVAYRWIADDPKYT